jgi:hypothetical protein
MVSIIRIKAVELKIIKRQSSQWTTGIDLRHYGDYLHVAKQTKLPVWLLFFHRDSAPSQSDLRFGCPAECPVGLFGGELFSLVTRENHRSPHFDPSRSGVAGHGRSGMVYWSVNQLRLLATKDEVVGVSESLDSEAA